MSALLSWLTPWWAKAAIAALVLGILAYGVHSYNEAVSAKAVVAALKDERAKTQPVIDELATRVATADKTITDYKAASDKLKVKVAVKTIEYKNALLQNKILADKNTKLLGDSDAFAGLLKSIEARNNDSADITSRSARFKQQSAAYLQCERDFRALAETTAETTRRLSEADSIIKALKN